MGQTRVNAPLQCNLGHKELKLPVFDTRKEQSESVR